MILSLDYDDTYTRDPVFWDSFIAYAQSRGHTVYCVTLRTPEQGEQVLASIGKLVKVYFTSMQSKSKYMYAMGIKIDVWIDDMPICIVEGIEVVNDGKIYE
jgi:hypothetical protein